MKTFVIFDIDGTLLYSNKADSQCFADTYEEIYQKEFPTIDWRNYPHVTDTTIFQTVIQAQFGRAVEQKEVEVFYIGVRNRRLSTDSAQEHICVKYSYAYIKINNNRRPIAN